MMRQFEIKSKIIPFCYVIKLLPIIVHKIATP